MISKQDVFLLLTELEESGVNCQEFFDTIYTNTFDTFKALKFINDNNGQLLTEGPSLPSWGDLGVSYTDVKLHK